MILNDNSTQQINTLAIQLQNKITNLNNELSNDFRKLNNNIDDLDSKISDLEKRDNLQENDTAAMKAEIKANTKAISGKADKYHTHTKSEITDFPTSLKNPNALTVNGKTYDGSSAVDAGVQTIANGGTGATDAASGFNTLADGVRYSSTPTDNEKMLLKPSGTWYKTTCLDFWNYIKGKISSVLGLTASSYANVQIGTGNVTGTKLIIQGTCVGSNSYTDANPKLVFKNNDESQNISLTFTDFDAVQAPASLTLNGNQGNEYFIAPCIKANNRMVIPIGAPSSPEDGCIWIS